MLFGSYLTIVTIVTIVRPVVFTTTVFISLDLICLKNKEYVKGQTTGVTDTELIRPLSLKGCFTVFVSLTAPITVFYFEPPPPPCGAGSDLWMFHRGPAAAATDKVDPLHQRQRQKNTKLFFSPTRLNHNCSPVPRAWTSNFQMPTQAGVITVISPVKNVRWW